jgi:uroporphyrinogen-III decarboxylase
MEQNRSRSPGIVPCGVSINYTIWERYEERLDKLQEECPHIRMSGKNGGKSPRAVEHKSRDAWGCLWHFPGMGLDGQVIEHPLDDWEKMKTWKPPSAAEHAAAIRKQVESLPEDQRPRHASLEHGFLFLRLTYLRGFDNFMLDVGEDNPKIFELRDIVADYWYEVTKARIECGARHISAGDDLGLPISPESWRELIKPAYKRIFSLARDRGYTVHLHTDGYIVDIIHDLLEIGVTDLNPQELVNGIDNLAKLLKGKAHISLDIDRQSVTVFGTPEKIDAHIKRCIQTLGSPQGGLSFVWGVYPGTPIENIEAAVRAMEKYRDMWAK